MSIYSEYYLEHYGVKGMKWGVRRAKKKYLKKAEAQLRANMSNIKALKNELDSDWDSIMEQRLDKETRSAYTHEQNTAIRAAKAWMAAREDIMNMDVRSFTASDVKNRFEKARKEARVYYPFG